MFSEEKVLDTKVAAETLLELAWEFGKDEFSTGGSRYRFVDDCFGRKSGHLLVKYPEGGVSVCKTKYVSYTRTMLYLLGRDFLPKDEIVSRFRLRGKAVVSRQVDGRSAGVRVADVLSGLRAAAGSDEILATRKQIALEAGVSTASVSVALKELAESGVLRASGTLQGMLIRFERKGF